MQFFGHTAAVQLDEEEGRAVFSKKTFPNMHRNTAELYTSRAVL